MRAVIRKRWIGRLLRELVRQDGNVRFVALAPPSDEDVLAVLRRMVVRLERLLRQACVSGGRRTVSAPSLGCGGTASP